MLFVVKVLGLSAMIMLVMAGLFIAYSLRDYREYRAKVIKEEDDRRFGITPYVD